MNSMKDHCSKTVDSYKKKVIKKHYKLHVLGFQMEDLGFGRLVSLGQENIFTLDRATLQDKFWMNSLLSDIFRDCQLSLRHFR